MVMPKIIIIRGNGNTTPQENWFPYVEKELGGQVEVINKEFPDPDLARASYWLPFIKTLGADEQTILVGHSSGAVAAMRFAEKHKILGSVLVAACYTDLGNEQEKVSGYFDTAWDWPAIRNNQRWLIQFASTNDPYIPIAEARYINQQLKTEYHEYADRGHFGADTGATTFPQLVESLKRKLKI